MKLIHFGEVDDRLEGQRGMVIWRQDGKIESVHLIATWTSRRKELMLFDYAHVVALARRMWWVRLEWTRADGLRLFRGSTASEKDYPQRDPAAPRKMIEYIRGS